MSFSEKTPRVSMAARLKKAETENQSLLDHLKDICRSERLYAEIKAVNSTCPVAVNDVQVFQVTPSNVSAVPLKVIVKRLLPGTSKVAIRSGSGWTQGKTFIRKLAADQKKRLDFGPKQIRPPSTKLYCSPKQKIRTLQQWQEKATFPKFLELPLELRELIYNFAYPIIYPYFYTGNVRGRFQAEYDYCIHSSHNVRLCSSPLPMLLVNRQVNEEATNTIYRSATFWFCDIDDLYKFTYAQDGTHLGPVRNMTLAFYPDFRCLRALGEDVDRMLDRTYYRKPRCDQTCRSSRLDRLTIEIQHRCGWTTRNRVNSEVLGGIPPFKYITMWKWIITATMRWNDGWKLAKAVKLTEALQGQRWSIDIEKEEKNPMRKPSSGKSLSHTPVEVYRRRGFSPFERQELATAKAMYKYLRYYAVRGDSPGIHEYTVPFNEHTAMD